MTPLFRVCLFLQYMSKSSMRPKNAVNVTQRLHCVSVTARCDSETDEFFISVAVRSIYLSCCACCTTKKKLVKVGYRFISNKHDTKSHFIACPSSYCFPYQLYDHNNLCESSSFQLRVCCKAHVVCKRRGRYYHRIYCNSR